MRKRKEERKGRKRERKKNKMENKEEGWKGPLIDFLAVENRNGMEISIVGVSSRIGKISRGRL